MYTPGAVHPELPAQGTWALGTGRTRPAWPSAPLPSRSWRSPTSPRRVPPSLLAYRASALGAVGRTEEAITASETLLTDLTRVLGRDAPDTLTARGNLAYWLGQAGRVDEAITASDTLLTDITRVLGRDAPDTLTARGNLAYWLGHAGRVDEAITASDTLLTDLTPVSYTHLTLPTKRIV